MRKIELRGEVLPGYAPGLPDTYGRHGERLCLILIP